MSVELWDVLDEHGNKTGRLHKRGKPLQPGESHLVVHIWIVNQKAEFLISKRALNAEMWPSMWHTTGGAAVAGDDSLTAALRETKEELGVDLDPNNGQLFKQHSRPCKQDIGAFVLMHAWLFRQEVDIASVLCQPEEICDAMWASKDEIRQLVAENKFYPYSYLEEVLDFCEETKYER